MDPFSIASRVFKKERPGAKWRAAPKELAPASKKKMPACLSPGLQGVDQIRGQVRDGFPDDSGAANDDRPMTFGSYVGTDPPDGNASGDRKGIFPAGSHKIAGPRIRVFPGRRRGRLFENDPQTEIQITGIHGQVLKVQRQEQSAGDRSRRWGPLFGRPVLRPKPTWGLH